MPSASSTRSAICVSRYPSGMVSRTVHATVPVRVDYELTELGRTLTAPIAALEAWARDHLDDVLVARERYDERAAGLG